MTPFYDLNQQLTPSTEEDHSFFTILSNDHTSSSSSNQYPFFFGTPQMQGVFQYHDHQQQHEFNIDHMMFQGSSNFPLSPPSSTQDNVVEGPSPDRCVRSEEARPESGKWMSSKMIQGSSNFPLSPPSSTQDDVVEGPSPDRCVRSEEGRPESGKWMSSKMRIMRKMMHPDHKVVARKPRSCKQAVLQGQHHQQSAQAGGGGADNPPPDGVLRVCSDCSTTKTPLWRSGPSGPKSLCNACGIRQRKARRALAAAAVVSSGLIPPLAPSTTAKTEHKHKGPDAERIVPFKKRCRFSSAAAAAVQKKLGFDDIVIRLSKSSAFHRVFPQDEKDAAILLMALSCGLMCS